MLTLTWQGKGALVAPGEANAAFLGLTDALGRLALPEGRPVSRYTAGPGEDGRPS
jgi:hypothetical protein